MNDVRPGFLASAVLFAAGFALLGLLAAAGAMLAFRSDLSLGINGIGQLSAGFVHGMTTTKRPSTIELDLGIMSAMVCLALVFFSYLAVGFVFFPETWPWPLIVI